MTKNGVVKKSLTKQALRGAWLAVLLLPAGTVGSSQTPKHGIVKAVAQVRFDPDDDVKCLRSAAENGDPATGPSTFVLRAPANCLIPWHYHTAEEQLIVVRGNVLTEMEGMPPQNLGPGGFAMMPGKAKHQFSCRPSKTSCLLFVTFDRAYDIFWVKDNQPSAGSGRLKPGI